MKLKSVEVEYIESGTFQGGEGDVYKAGIERDETCRVLSEVNFQHASKCVTALAGLNPEAIKDVVEALEWIDKQMNLDSEEETVVADDRETAIDMCWNRAHAALRKLKEGQQC
jgi:hypothetical protein